MGCFYISLLFAFFILVVLVELFTPLSGFQTIGVSGGALACLAVCVHLTVFINRKRISAAYHKRELKKKIKKELKSKIEEKNTSKMHSFELMPAKQLTESLFTRDLKQSIPSELKIMAESLKDYVYEHQIIVLDDDIDLIELLIKKIEVTLKEAELNAYQVFERTDLRYSTLNILWEDINNNLSDISDSYDLVKSIGENIHKTVDEIIELRDKAILRQELGETYKQRESQLVTSIKSETQRMAKSLKGIATAFENTFDNSNKTRTEKRSNIKEEPASNRKVRPESKGYFSPLQQLNKDRLESIGTKTSCGDASLTYSNVRQTVSNYTDEQLCHFVNHSTNSDLNKKPGFYYAVVTEIYLRLESENIEAST